MERYHAASGLSLTARHPARAERTPGTAATDARGPAAARRQALYVVSDALIAANRTRIITLALGARLPTIFSYRDYVQAGGLMSYGANFPTLFRRAADLVDKILRGASPGDMPVEQPTKFELVINLTVAKALGLKLPESFLLRADEVIE